MTRGFSAEAAGRQPLTAGFHTSARPQNGTGAARDGGDCVVEEEPPPPTAERSASAALRRTALRG